MPKLYTVGGCVRDELLGLKSKDIDFTFVLDDLSKSVEEGFQQMSHWMTEQGFEIFLSVPEMYTIRARFPKDHINAKLVADFVMARKELSYDSNSRKPVLVLGTIEDDLIRRDFTLNALAIDEDGKLIDLFNGVKALNDRVLITPRAPEITLMDDPLRFLRALRFSITKGFAIHDDILQAVIENTEIFNKLKLVVSAERIRDEVFKMFHHDTVKTLFLFSELEKQIPGITELIFSKGLWLKPTFEL